MKKTTQISLLIVIMSLVFALPVYANNFASDADYYSNEEYIQYDNLSEAFEEFEKTIVLDEWYEWFNALTPEEQATVNYRPENFAETQRNKYGIDTSNILTVIPVNPSMTTNDTKSGFLKTEDMSIMTATLPTSGWELPYNPSYWNSSSVRPYANCYCYALNVKTNMPGGMNLGALAGKALSLSTSVLETNIKADMPYIANYAKWTSTALSRLAKVNTIVVAYFCS